MADPGGRRRLAGLLRSWFSFTEPVSRRTYLLTGLTLMTVKYAVEALAVHAVTGSWWTPFAYFSPSVARFRDLHAPVLAFAIAFWSLPLALIGAALGRAITLRGHAGRMPIHAIHMRVLRHIKALSEAPPVSLR